MAAKKTAKKRPAPKGSSWICKVKKDEPRRGCAGGAKVAKRKPAAKKNAPAKKR